jgi:SAM-dependent methyltransferase
VVFSSLVIHYVERLDLLFAEFARVLAPSGVFVFSTHHLQSDFAFHGGSYFTTTLVTERWRGFGEEPITISFYRRPLSDITEALWQTGFVVERLTEPKPTEDYKAVDPEEYAQKMVEPGFLRMRARKTA